MILCSRATLQATRLWQLGSGKVLGGFYEQIQAEEILKKSKGFC
jgi:hypothetical protein